MRRLWVEMMGAPLLCHALSYRQQLCNLGQLFLVLLVDLSVDHRTPTRDYLDCYVTYVCMHRKAVQAGRLGQATVEIVVDAAQEESADGGPRPQWRSTAAIGKKKYSWLHTCNAKFMAKREAAAMLLEELLPGVHQGEQRGGKL